MTNTRYITITSALLLLMLTTDAAAQWKQLPIPAVHGKIACASDGSLRVLTNGTLCYSDTGRKSWTYQSFPYDLRDRTFYPLRQMLLASDDTMLIISMSGDVYSVVRGEETLRPASEGLRSKNPRGPFLLTSRGKRGELLLCHEQFYASTNNGASWELRYSDPGSGSFGPGAVDPWNTDVMLLLNANIIHRSTDAGATWRMIPMELSSYGAADMIVCPDGQIHAGRYHSSNCGETWRTYPMEGGIDDYWGDDNLKYVYNSQEHSVYALNRLYGLFCRDLDNPTFQITTLSSSYDRWIRSFRLSADVSYDARSGKMFAIVNDSLYEYLRGEVALLSNTVSAAPVNGLLAYNAEGDTLLVSTPHTTLKSTDAGRTWESTSIRGVGHFKMEVMHSKRSKDMIYQFNRENQIIWVIENEKSLEKWIRLVGPCKPTYDPFSKDTFHGGSNGLWRLNDSEVLSADSTAVLMGELYAGTPVLAQCLSFDKHREGAILLAGLDRDDGKTPQLHRTGNYGFSWARITSIALNETPIDIIFDDAVENRILVIEPTGVHISTDDGVTWQYRDPGLGSRKITSVAIDPDNASTMFLGVTSPSRLDPIPQSREDGGGVWQSTDSGMTWGKLPINGLHNYNISHVLALRNPRRVLVGTPCGAYEYLLDSTTSVTPQSAAPTGGVEFEIYPNPGRGVVNIRYTISAPSAVRVAVYDVLGRVVSVQSVDAASGGSHTLTLATAALRDGVYIVTLETQSGIAARRMLLAR
jgi:photosystem II stability/assembly factor-like uncharacterized protein